MNEILIALESLVGPPIIWEDGKKDFTRLIRNNKDEDYFRDYLIELFKNKKIVKDVVKYPALIKNKNMRIKLANEFLFMYGPKTIYE